MATPLATLARNLVRATPTVTGDPDALADVSAQALGDLDWACPRSGASRGRRGTPRRWRGPRRAGWRPRRPDRAPCSPPSRRTCAAARRSPRGRAGAPARRPSPCARRAPWPRSSRRARRPRRRSPGGRGGEGRPAARPRRRTRRRRRAGSWPRSTRTYVRIETAKLNRASRLGSGDVVEARVYPVRGKDKKRRPPTVRCGGPPHFHTSLLRCRYSQCSSPHSSAVAPPRSRSRSRRVGRPSPSRSRPRERPERPRSPGRPASESRSTSAARRSLNEDLAREASNGPTVFTVSATKTAKFVDTNTLPGTARTSSPSTRTDLHRAR